MAGRIMHFLPFIVMGVFAFLLAFIEFWIAITWNNMAASPLASDAAASTRIAIAGLHIQLGTAFGFIGSLFMLTGTFLKKQAARIATLENSLKESVHQQRVS